MSKVIPYEDLMNRPHLYEPLGSCKSVHNLECKPTFTDVDIVKLFKSKYNVAYLSRTMYGTAQKNGSDMSHEYILRNIPTWMSKYTLHNNLRKYTLLEGQQDWVALLRFINNEFLSKCYNMLQWNSFVPTRMSAIVDGEEKKFSDLTYEDYQKLNFWEVQDVNRSDNSFRNNNEIPYWRRHIHMRHYDRDNDGLQYDNPNRASLDTPIYQRTARTNDELIDFWSRKNWYDMCKW